MDYLRGHKRLFITFAVVLFLIPTSSLVLSARFKQAGLVTQIYDRSLSTLNEVPGTSPIKDLLKSLNSVPSPTPATPSSDLGQFGPTLKIAISIEGRPQADQHTKLFVGIAQGIPTNSPQYLLTFSVNVPESGVYNNISLIGLIQGTTYTAYLKGQSQIAKAVSFIMSPQGVILNSGKPVELTSGDLNEDNIIDSADIAIVTAALGATPSSSKWNPAADLNLDGIINSIDLGLVNKNQGKIGDGGQWYSPPPQASSSATLAVPSNLGGPGESSASGVYWLWVPQ